ENQASRRIRPVAAAVERVKHALGPRAGATGGRAELKNHSAAARAAAIGPGQVAATGGCAVEVSPGVEDQARIRHTPVAAAGESAKHGLGPWGTADAGRPELK